MFVARVPCSVVLKVTAFTICGDKFARVTTCFHLLYSFELNAFLCALNTMRYHTVRIPEVVGQFFVLLHFG